MTHDIIAQIVKPLEWVPFGERGFRAYCHLSMSSFYVSCGDDCAQIDKERTASIAGALNLDAVLALVAAAYADAAARCHGFYVDEDDTTTELPDHIRKRTPTDATAALARMLADARREGMEMAAVKATSFLVGDPKNDIPLRSPGPHEIAAAIRAMKGKQG